MKKKLAFMGALVVTLLPMAAFATDGITPLITMVGNWVHALVPIMMGVAVCYFIYGVITFISVSDSEKKTAARGVMIQGIIGVACILGLYGISGLLLSTAGADSTSLSKTGTIPTF